MDNILPKFQTFTLSNIGTNDSSSSSSQWKPNEAIIDKKYLTRKISIEKQTPLTNYEINKLAPNERYQKIVYEDKDPSPLSMTERGVADTPKMNYIQSKGPKEAPINEKLAAIVKIQNGGLVPIQLFYQNLTDVIDTTLMPFRTEIRFPNGKYPKDDSLTSTFEMFCTTTRRLSVIMSLKQQIQTHMFRCGSIGIEVEMKNNKLLCTNIFENSQAWPYANDLLNSEIIAVNGVRVITLSEFRHALSAARETNQSIILQVISQLGKNEILDDLIHFHKKSRKMAKLVSGAFEEASLGDDVSISSKVEIYDNYKHESKNNSEKKGGRLQNDEDDYNYDDSKYISNENDQLKIHRPFSSDTKQQRISNYSTMSESSDSLYIDPAEEAAVQETLLANPRRTSTVVHDTLEYLQEIGNSKVEDDDDKNGGIIQVKRVTSNIEPKIMMPPVLENDNNEEAVSENEPEVTQPTEQREHTAWDYATALDENDVTSHRHLVCVPKSLKSSENGWGNPSQKTCMHIANYSQIWQLDISWVGEDCGLVSRAVLNSGDIHLELMSSEHVWCLTVTRKVQQGDDNTRKLVDDAGNFPEDVSNSSSSSILFRPPSTENSTQFSPATSVLWVPWHSVAFAECSKQLVNSNLGRSETIDLFIKVFDSTKSDTKLSSSKRINRKK